MIEKNNIADIVIEKNKQEIEAIEKRIDLGLASNYNGKMQKIAFGYGINPIIVEEILKRYGKSGWAIKHVFNDNGSSIFEIE